MSLTRAVSKCFRKAPVVSRNFTAFSCGGKNMVSPGQILHFERYAHVQSTSYTRERKMNKAFQARWRAATFVEFNRRKKRVAIDQILRDGKEKVVRRSQFTDWNYDAEISAFQVSIDRLYGNVIYNN